MSKQPPTNFLKYIDTAFQTFVLPIAPVGAKLAEDSSLTAEHLGKIPGTWSASQRVWYGYPGWQKLRTKKQDIEKFHHWQDPDKCDTAIALALRLGEIVAIDVDANDQWTAEEIELLARIELGEPLCVRRREGSARRSLPTRCGRGYAPKQRRTGKAL
jgi:hypothetical protein